MMMIVMIMIMIMIMIMVKVMMMMMMVKVVMLFPYAKRSLSVICCLHQVPGGGRMDVKQQH